MHTYQECSKRTASPRQTAPLTAEKPAHSALRLQRMIGNAATTRLLKPTIQRTITIKNYNTKQGGVEEDQELNIPALREAVGQKVTDGGDKAKVLANITTANTQNATNLDVAALAARLCANAAKPGTVAQVSDAIGSTIPNPKESEAKLWEGLILRADSMSYSKGTPCVIALDKLKIADKADIQGTIDKIRAVNNKLAALVNHEATLKEEPSTNWVTLLKEGDLDIRVTHENGAGWLPTGNVAATFGGYEQTINNKLQLPNVQRNITGGATTEDKMRYTFVKSQLNTAARRYYAWGAHGGNNSPYIEASVPGNKDARIVFDYEREIFFYTVHYNWHKGYNPFFSITGA